MRFLRMLTNSLLAGALGAAFLTIIVLQLNPSVPASSEFVSMRRNRMAQVYTSAYAARRRRRGNFQYAAVG